MTGPGWSPPLLDQPEEGYRFTSDAFMLASFAARMRPQRWADLGTGAGVIAYQLATYLPNSKGLALERVPEQAHYARRNLNGLPVSVALGDCRRFPFKPRSLDLVVTNPPYFQKGSGNLNQAQARRQGRHTLHGDVVTFAAAGLRGMDADARFCFIYPNHRLDRELPALAALGLFPEKRLEIRPFAHRPINQVCLALTRNKPAEVRVEQLILFEEHRRFSPQAVAFLSLQ